MFEISNVCPGCGLKMLSGEPGLDARFYASQVCVALYWDLSAFTLSLQDSDFIHQLVVDAYAAQHTGTATKPITTAFSLFGLYLTFEQGYTGREVQLAHIKLGKRRVRWLKFDTPPATAALTVRDALQKIAPGNYREPITNWGKAVWDLWLPEHRRVKGLLETYYKG